ncbi:MAG: prolipoprotein diacylglyceryl transferase [Myxococcota bacterium]|jgi:phosphatidylglycerol---prolipoprotein diacylglyceryl transferase|nr:prolipoprotein diacylglyceryl transferase [Myxococcota bacterium]
MYPELFTIPGLNYTVSSFGVMMSLGFLIGYWITYSRMEELGLDPEPVTNILIWIMLGGIIGSKLYYATDVSIREGYPFADLFFARAGITWYGGLMGGTLAGVLGCRFLKIPTLAFSNAVAPALAVGQSFGRIGCFLVGDDYGKVSSVPWAIAFPNGAPPTFERVHPTQLYEVGWLLPVALFLWWRRDKSPFLLGEYLVLNGAGRIVIENWRVNQKVFLGMTEPQLIGFALVCIGSGLWFYFLKTGRSMESAQATS